MNVAYLIMLVGDAVGCVNLARIVEVTPIDSASPAMVDVVFRCVTVAALLSMIPEKWYTFLLMIDVLLSMVISSEV